MSQAAGHETAQRRLNILRFGLTMLTALTFAGVTAISYIMSAVPDGVGDLVPAALQGLLWGVAAAIVSFIIYRVYKLAVLKM